MITFIKKKLPALLMVLAMVLLTGCGEYVPEEFQRFLPEEMRDSASAKKAASPGALKAALEDAGFLDEDAFDQKYERFYGQDDNNEEFYQQLRSDGVAGSMLMDDDLDFEDYPGLRQYLMYDLSEYSLYEGELVSGYDAIALLTFSSDRAASPRTKKASL